MSDIIAVQSSGFLKRTALHALHVARGAKMAPFAAYDMPIQYPQGVLKEHLHTRSAAGLFDVSHMGQIRLTAKSGDVGDAALALEQLVPADIAGLEAGRQRYTQLTNDAGGILDDLMVARLGSYLLLIVNAACKVGDEAHLRARLAHSCEIEALDRALLALQGPRAAEVLAALAPASTEMRFMEVRELKIAGIPCIAVRSGYCGEDGFEISMPNEGARTIADALLAQPGVALIGLGARDSLRLEAGLCLYGSDIDVATTPVEAGLAWSIQPARRSGGARAGGFPGADTILAQVSEGTSRTRVGLRPEGRAPVRAGSPLYAAETGGKPTGVVTSGGFGPSLNAPVAMGYVPAEHAKAGTLVFAEVRGQRLPARVAETAFVKRNYKRS